MEKPILFNTEMVRAILGGRKTVTRRICKRLENHNFEWGLDREPYIGDYKTFDEIEKGKWGLVTLENQWLFDLQTAVDDSKTYLLKPPYKVGDILWARETWAFIDNLNAGVGNDQYYEYKADTNNPLPGDWPIEEKGGTRLRWKPSIHMPREAARLFLKVTDVRIERLQKITAHECILEGISSENVLVNTPNGDFSKYTINQFSKLWNSTVKKGDLERYGWKANPWVWVIDFKRIDSAHSK